jgi:hypothetical protein
MINILGREYTITYTDSPSEVDMYKRESLFGQIDFWTRTIRVYAKDQSNYCVLQTLIHEILHGIESELKLECFKGERGHEELDTLANALVDTLTRNEWIKIK